MKDYARWLSHARPRSQGCTPSLHRIDLTPAARLPDEFARMSKRELTSVWVAYVTDALEFDPDCSTGAIARALAVVAERLHTPVAED